MDLIDRLREIALRIPTLRSHVTTEEATKTALVMPFISALGYSVFDPSEVVPEFTADVGTKKGEKVDYAIMRDGEPIMLFECKCVDCDLDHAHASQLYRYFSVTPARFGVLTNGIEYRFFSDLDEPNKMDARPFLEFGLLEIDDKLAEEIKKFGKQTFDLETIISTASELKYTKGIKRILHEEWLNPSSAFVRTLASRVYDGNLTQSVRQQFAGIVKRAFHEFVNTRVNERLQSALERSEKHEAAEAASGTSAPSTEEQEEAKRGIETTEEEIEGFQIVRAILAGTVDAHRVFLRDTRRYCGILLDDTNRKPICRLWFNQAQKYLGLFDAEKNEEKHAIDDPTSIYRFAEQIRATIHRYDDIASSQHTETRESAGG